MSNLSPASVVVDPSDGTTVKIVNNLAERYLGSGIVQDVKTSTSNSSVAQLAAGASFTGTGESTFGVAGLQINVYSDQPIRVQAQQSMDNANWDIVDTYDLPLGTGDGRTIQATASYIRVVITNLGHVTTTQFRLQTILCPTVEAVPRAGTPLTGALRLSRSTRNFAPSPFNFQNIGEARALTLDVSRNLVTRSTVLTDEVSFRSDFTEGALYTNLTGTCYFRNGQNHVVGDSTSFLSEVLIGQFLRLDIDGDDHLVRVEDVFSDTDLLIEEAYTGTTGNGVGKIADWLYSIGTDGALAESGSEIVISSGTDDDQTTAVYRPGDYLPFVVGFSAKMSQRIANQEAGVGLTSGTPGNCNKQAIVVFDGTDNTKVKLRTSFSNTDIEETTVTIPFGGTSASYHDYQIKLTNTWCVLWVDNVRLAEHRVHIPGPYDELSLCAHLTNGTGAVSSTDLTMDYIVLSNFDRIEIGLTPQGEPLVVQPVQGSQSSITSVAAAILDTELLDHNQSRIGATVYNDSTSSMYLKLGTGASPTSFTVLLKAGDYYETPFNYLGPIHGYWVSATGSARLTEVF